jgi:hypothetical protein
MTVNRDCGQLFYPRLPIIGYYLLPRFILKQIFTPAGHMSTYVLKNGARINQNSLTTFEYHGDGQWGQVNGEVAIHAAGKKVTIQLADLTIEVKENSSVNICNRSYDSCAYITAIEGHSLICRHGKEDKLAANHCASYDFAHSITVDSCNCKDATAWTEGYIRGDSIPLRIAMNTLGDWFGKKVSYHSDSAPTLKRKIGFKYIDSKLPDALNQMQLRYGVSCVMEDDRIIVRD